VTTNLSVAALAAIVPGKENFHSLSMIMLLIFAVLYKTINACSELKFSFA
jgi:hypothetical protein